MAESIAERVQQVVAETQAGIVGPDVSDIEAEARVEVVGEHTTKVVDGPSEPFADVHVLEQHPCAEAVERALAGPRVGMEDHVAVERKRGDHVDHVRR